VVKSIYLIDPLTGLYNRNVVEEFLKKELERAKRHKYDVSFIMADLDNFKQINDKFGHITGDEVLKNFAKIILENIRSSDYGIRYGGEEFLVVLIYTQAKEAFAKAEDIRQKLENSSTEGIKITASFGVTSLGLHPEKSLEELLIVADQALYLAKSSGKNRVEVL